MRQSDPTKESGKSLGDRVREGDWQALRQLEAELEALRDWLEAMPEALRSEAEKWEDWWRECPS